MTGPTYADTDDYVLSRMEGRSQDADQRNRGCHRPRALEEEKARLLLEH